MLRERKSPTGSLTNVDMQEKHLTYRKEIVFACLALAFAIGAAYDTRFIVSMERLRAVIAAAIIACFGAIFLLSRYPRSVIQPAILAAWPLHLFTVVFVGFSWCFHGGGPKGTIIAYTIVGYATWLLVPLCLLLDRQLFDRFVKMVAIGCAVLAIPSYIGALGVDSILGVPLSNKYALLQLFRHHCQRRCIRAC